LKFFMSIKMCVVHCTSHLPAVIAVTDTGAYVGYREDKHWSLVTFTLAWNKHCEILGEEFST
jgi:hypothetical protein